MMANRRNTKVQYPSPDQNPLSSGPRRDIIELIVSQSADEARFVTNLNSPAIPHIPLFHPVCCHSQAVTLHRSRELIEKDALQTGRSGVRYFECSVET